LENFEEMKRFGAQVFKGRHHSTDVEQAKVFFEQRLRQAIYPEAESLIAKFRQNGFAFYIVSATYRFMVAPYAQHLGATHFWGCELEVVDGLCTGHIVGTVYHQEKKAQVLRELAQSSGIALEHSYAFGDSMNDLPMLEAVGHPVAVNPGRKLRRLAQARGWAIARW
jgi:HAD superfamily hydrolase (TIGR01490 family)